MGRVAGKVALVAGAGGGIGGAGGEALAREGAAVFCTDRDGAAAEATAARFRAAGGRAAASALDVREFGRLDIVLESAGVSHRRNFLEVDAETWDRIVAVNLTGTFHVGQAAARQMVKEGGGSIINVTSQLAEVARPERVPYVASKGDARSLTQAMAVDLAGHGISGNAIAPGPALTGLTRELHRPRGAACDRSGDPARPARPARRSRRGGAASRLRRVPLGNRQHGHGGRRLSGDLRRGQ